MSSERLAASSGRVEKASELFNDSAFGDLNDLREPPPEDPLAKDVSELTELRPDLAEGRDMSSRTEGFFANAFPPPAIFDKAKNIRTRAL